MNQLERLAKWLLQRRGFVVSARAGLGMTLSGNAVAIRHKDGSFTVHLMQGADRVTLQLGSQLIEADE